MNHTIFDSNENEAVRDWSTLRLVAYCCSIYQLFSWQNVFQKSFRGQKLHKQMWKLLFISFIQCLLLVYPPEPHSHMCEVQYGV